ncbi:hypothetical protein [Tunturiibacter gelidiferens]|uniref:hypothetical protein n=1 Tax=Tunturiibacter gelidiferens TaxID=3069689 RepID=UPI003D9B862E
MKNSISPMELIAKWNPSQDMSVELPSSVRWADGTCATHNDYLQHMLDTHTFVGDCENGREIRMFPNIVADVRYDHSAQTWAVSGVGVTPSALALTDPDASDDQITAALYALPVVYRSNIRR